MPHQKHLKYRFQIKGFNFAKFEDAEKVLSIKADTFTIKKKKLGFFRLGLIHTAVFENAVIDLSLKRKVPVDDTIETIQTREELPSLKDILPSFSTMRISSIILKPVCLTLRDEHSLLTQITSNSAIIKLTKKNIRFTGNVHVVSGDKSLTTERLNFLIEDFVMKARQHFILETPGEKIEGKQITLDLSLDVVKVKKIIKPDNSTK